MRAIFTLTVLAVLFGGVFSPAAFVSAQSSVDQCGCWCGTQGTGLKFIGNDYDQDSCKAECKTRNQDDAIQCLRQGDIGPEANPRCWSQDACESPDANGNQGKWADEQNAECLPGFRFCESIVTDQNAPTLGVPIGGFSRVRNIGAYISVAYTFLIGAGAVLAIIMIIIAGIQYMLSAGAGEAKAAKERIQKALTGFVLLLASYMLLQIVNPRTLNVDIEGVQRLRPFELTDGQTCEDFARLGYKDENGAALPRTSQCGDKRQLGEDGSGTPVENLFCYYRGCSSDAEVCQINRRTGEGECQSCTRVEDDSDISPSPSRSVCESLSFNRGSTDAQCMHVPPANQGAQAVFSESYCGLVNLTCGRSGVSGGVDFTSPFAIVDVYEGLGGITECENYNTININGGGDSSNVRALSNARGTAEPLRTLCQKDPCNFGNCQLVDDRNDYTGQYRCVSK